MTTVCPCGSGHPFTDCCDRYISGAAMAPTAEALMRSRYTAFATGAIDYLENTLLPGTRDDFDRAHVTEWSSSSQWTALTIIATSGGGPDDNAGEVHFVARFRLKDKEHAHEEVSRFVKQDGCWWYVDGTVGPRPRTVVKIGRNEPCPCGSGKKYKKCCAA